MPKINVKDDSDNSEDPALVAKVDEMMEPDQEANDSPAEEEVSTEPSDEEASDQPQDDSGLPPLDIFADTPGAPILSGKKSKKTIKPVVTDEQPTEITEPVPVVDKSADETNDKDSEPLTADTTEVEEYDDAQTAKAIDDIVAHESDAVLRAEDAQTAQRQAESQPVTEKKKRGHPIFWGLVILICLVAIGMALFLVDPSIYKPLSKVNWSSLKRHL